MALFAQTFGKSCSASPAIHFDANTLNNEAIHETQTSENEVHATGDMKANILEPCLADMTDLERCVLFV